MLVLGRSWGEQILIGKDIVITVVRIDQGYVRIGIDAPKGINIVRAELVSFEPGDVSKDSIDGD